MLTLIAATALVSTKFPGGTLNQFATALAEETKQSVVISMATPTSLPALEFDPANLNEFSRVLRNQTRLIIMPGTDLVLSDGRLSYAQVSTATRLESGARQYGPIPLPPTALKEGKVTFKTEKQECLELDSLQSSLSKPLSIHWFYLKNTVTCNVKDLPEADFLKWVGKAVGGRLLADAKGYKLDLDAVEVKRRAVKTILEEQFGTADKQALAVNEKKRNFRVACINALTVAELSDVLSSPGAQAKIQLSGTSPLARAAASYVQGMEQLQGSGSDVMQHIDHSRQAWLTMTSTFQPALEIPVLDENGRPGGIVRF